MSIKRIEAGVLDMKKLISTIFVISFLLNSSCRNDEIATGLLASVGDTNVETVEQALKNLDSSRSNSSALIADSISILTYPGVMADGTGNSAPGIQMAIDDAGEAGKVLYVPEGKYRLAGEPSKDNPKLAKLGLVIKKPIKIVGAGLKKSVLFIDKDKDGFRFRSLFWIRNVKNVTIQDIALEGVGVDGYAITIHQDVEGTLESSHGFPSSTTVVENISVLRNKFSNFRAPYWIAVSNSSHKQTVENIRIEENLFISAAGNAINPENIGSSASAIGLIGSRTHKDSQISNVQILKNAFHAQHIKGAVVVWSGVEKTTIKDNVIVGAGTSNAIPNDSGAYAILVYSNAYDMDPNDRTKATLTGGTRPFLTSIDDNKIYEPKSCGIYIANGVQTYIRGNLIRGQRDTQDGSLPKGAISINGPLNLIASGNELSDNSIGISVVMPNDFAALRYDKKHAITLSENSISVGRGGVGVKIQMTGMPDGKIVFEKSRMKSLYGDGASVVVIQPDTEKSYGVFEAQDIFQTNFARHMKIRNFEGRSICPRFFSGPNNVDNIAFQASELVPFEIQRSFD